MPARAIAVTDTSVRAAARLAGAAYVAVFVLALFANFAVRMRLVDPDDPAATTRNLAESSTAVRLAVAAFVVVFLLDVLIAWALYVLLRPACPSRALHAAWFRLAYTVFLGVATAFLFVALLLATDGSYAERMGSAQVEGFVMLALQAFDYTWLVGLAAFGIHLILVGRILTSARVAPALLGWVLAVGGGAYLVDTFARTLVADYDAIAGVLLVLVAVPSILGELGFAVWLLTRAGRSVEALAGPPGELPDPGRAAVRERMRARSGAGAVR